MLEYPFLTIFKYPLGNIRYIGGYMYAKSVKKFEKIPNGDEPKLRDTWWSELSIETRSQLIL